MGPPKGLRAVLRDLKRRKVFHVGGVYLVTAWGASLGAAELFPMFGIPSWSVRFFVIGAILGFPLALIMAWLFEVSAQGDGVRIDYGDTEEELASLTTIWDASETLEISWTESSRNQTRRFRNVCVIGRDHAADLTLLDNMVSRFHAEIRLIDNQWMIKDLKSSNGTRVNDHKIEEAVPLTTEARIVLYDGGPSLHVRLISPASQQTVIKTS